MAKWAVSSSSDPSLSRREVLIVRIEDQDIMEKSIWNSYLKINYL